MGNKGAFINLIGGKLDKPDFKTYEAVVSCDHVLRSCVPCEFVC